MASKKQKNDEQSVFNRRYCTWRQAYFKALEGIFKTHQEQIAELLTDEEFASFNKIATSKPKRPKVEKPWAIQ